RRARALTQSRTSASVGGAPSSRLGAARRTTASLVDTGQSGLQSGESLEEPIPVVAFDPALRRSISERRATGPISERIQTDQEPSDRGSVVGVLIGDDEREPDGDEGRAADATRSDIRKLLPDLRCARDLEPAHNDGKDDYHDEAAAHGLAPVERPPTDGQRRRAPRLPCIRGCAATLARVGLQRVGCQVRRHETYLRNDACGR